MTRVPQKRTTKNPKTDVPYEAGFYKLFEELFLNLQAACSILSSRKVVQKQGIPYAMKTNHKISNVFFFYTTPLLETKYFIYTSEKSPDSEVPDS